MSNYIPTFTQKSSHFQHKYQNILASRSHVLPTALRDRNHFRCGTNAVPHVDAVCRVLSTKGDVEGTQLSYIIIDALFDPGWEVLCHLLVS